MRRGLLFVLMLLPTLLFATDVAEDELRTLGTQDINFINYQGPHDRIDTADEIRAIGRALGASIGIPYSSFDYAGKYRVIHAVDPAVKTGFDADIVVPLPTAQVDHIDNMRRIISGFLEAAYGYGRADADLLARFVTIYNAVVRGDMQFFGARYKPVVVKNLTSETAGLSRRYDEWPGKSRIVIPLSAGAQAGVLGSVETGQLAGDRVIEQLRTQEDKGVQDRQDLVDLMDRVVTEKEQQIAQQESTITQEQQRIAQEQQAIQQDRQTLQDQQTALTDQQRQQQEQQLAQREQQLQADRQAVEQSQQDLQQQRQSAAELTGTIRAERERIASDARSLDERQISDEVRGLAGGITPVYFIQVRDQAGVVLGQLVQINPETGILINRSAENRIVTRSYAFIGGRLVIIAAEGEAGRLVLFDTTSLEESGRGTDEIFLGSSLQVYGEPGAIYAVVKQEGIWYVGRFDSGLALLERSVIAVNPYTTFAFSAGKVWIQTADDRVVALSLIDMRVAP